MRTALRIVLPLLVLVLVWRLADGPAALDRLRSADPGWLAVSLVLVLAQTVLSAWRWHRVAGMLGLPLAPGRAVAEYFVAQLGNQTLPGGVLGDAARVARSRAGAGVRVAVWAVVAERLAGQVALFALLIPAAGLSVVAGRMPWPGWSGPVWLCATAVAATALIWGLRAPVLAPARSALLSPGGRLSLWLGSAVIVALNLCAFAAAARATGTALSAEAIVTLIPLILTAMLVPFGLAGWGWREGAAAALFPLAGAAPEAGLAASAAFGLVVLVAALPGVFWLTGTSRR
jgi:glycosyltransferase 2 family protein